MKFGIMSLDYKRFPLETCFAIARKYGFDGLEIFGSRLHLYPDDLTTTRAKEILGYKKKYGIEVPMYTPNALNLPFCICSTNPQERKDGVDYYKKAIDVANAIEIPRVLVVADHPGYDADRIETWAYLVESLTTICDYATDKGVEVTIEPLTPLESPMVTSADDCFRLIDTIKSESLFAMMDIVPPIVIHEPFTRYFDLLGNKMNYIHICNTDGMTDAHFELDHGILNLFDVLNTFKLNHFDGYLTTELYSEVQKDPELLAASTSRILKEIRQQLDI